MSSAAHVALVERGIPAWTCPVHGESLDGEESRLLCPRGHDYTVVRGIPRFVTSEKYVEHFGLQWRSYAKTQLDSYTGTHITRDRLRRCIGSELWERLSGLSVLECGCGAGRFTEVLLDQGAVVTSVDLSSAVETNAELFPVNEHQRVAQAEIENLPFEEHQFDLVLCLGVIQHTPNPERTIRQLYRQVKPGGWLVIDHYTTGADRWTNAKPVYRAVLKRLPARTALRFTELLVDTFLPMHRRFKNSNPLWFLLCRVSPLTTFYRSFPSLPETLQREWALLDTHDSLTDWFKHLRTVPQIRHTLTGLQVANIWCEYGGNGVEARCMRPLAAA